MPHRSVFENGLLKVAAFEAVDIRDDEGRGLVRELDAFDVCVVKGLAESLNPANGDVLCELEEEAAADARLEQLWSFGKRC